MPTTLAFSVGKKYLSRFALPVLVFFASPALAQATSAQATSPPDNLSFLQLQIHRGEAEHAARSLETILNQIEAINHRYHPDLVVPLTLIGDAAMVQGEPEKALQHFSRARHIARVSHGLFDQRQIAILYREADALRQVGKLEDTKNREEQAYEVARKAFPGNDPRLLPALDRLATFYLSTYNYLPARSIYNRALSLHESNKTDLTPQAVPVLLGIALSHRLERFPPIYMRNSDDNRLEGPTPGLTNSDLDALHLNFNSFPAGERALQRVVEIRRNEKPTDPLAIRKAILGLADWHMMFGRANTANTLYGHVYEEMIATDQDPSSLFGSPRMIYLPRPQNPKAPPANQRDSQTTGHVKVQFTVSPTGRIRKLRTVDSEPRKLMDFRVRRSMRLAVFRPKLEAGIATAAVGETYTYEFPYYPRIGDLSPLETQSSDDDPAPADVNPDTHPDPIETTKMEATEDV
ncbi:MAG: hypothetical protein GXP16_16590 [Gammaproteobacteria bacterium]|nr:hypothetical protein [Gammaproteobacteria bacterium]